MRRRTRALLFATVLAVCVGCDQASKHLAQETLAHSPGVSLLADTVRLELTRNPGAFLSLGAALPAELRRVLFLAVVPLALAFVVVVFLRASGRSAAPLLGVALIAGGGIGNWLDRLRQDGAVTDFLLLQLGPLRTGIFNLADVAIVAGVVLVLLTSHGLARPEERPL